LENCNRAAGCSNGGRRGPLPRMGQRVVATSGAQRNSWTRVSSRSPRSGRRRACTPNTVPGGSLPRPLAGAGVMLHRIPRVSLRSTRGYRLPPRWGGVVRAIPRELGSLRPCVARIILYISSAELVADGVEIFHRLLDAVAVVALERVAQAVEGAFDLAAHVGRDLLAVFLERLLGLIGERFRPGFSGRSLRGASCPRRRGPRRRASSSRSHPWTSRRRSAR
jgi:hypothetical protein